MHHESGPNLLDVPVWLAALWKRSGSWTSFVSEDSTPPTFLPALASMETAAIARRHALVEVCHFAGYSSSCAGLLQLLALGRPVGPGWYTYGCVDLTCCAGTARFALPSRLLICMSWDRRVFSISGLWPQTIQLGTLPSQSTCRAADNHCKLNLTLNPFTHITRLEPRLALTPSHSNHAALWKGADADHLWAVITRCRPNKFTMSMR